MATTPDAFYLPLGDQRFRATAATIGPWDPRLQHGSPPAALLAHVVEKTLPRPAASPARIAHLAYDFFGPVPAGDLTVVAEVVRPGARIERSRARLEVDGRLCMAASVWRIAAAPDRAPPVLPSLTPPPLPPPRAQALFVDVPSFGYGEALEWRFAEGAFDRPGPAAVWTRPRIPLLPGEEPSPLGRLLLMVDSANGISAELPPSKYTFVPVELTVAVERHPRTEWVGMRARTTIEPDGIGLTRADLFDEEGLLGVAVQTLFVAPR